MSSERFALLGNPAHQSLSPMIHQHFASQCALAIDYNTVELPTTISVLELRQWCDQFFLTGGRGLNITAPFKGLAAAAADRLTDNAAQAQAVNALYCIDNVLIGDNTDGIGLVHAMQSQQIALAHSSWLLLGAGGAAAGIIAPLLAQGAALTLYNRTKSKAEALVQRFESQGAIRLLHESDQRKFTGILNACALSCNEWPAWLAATIRASQLVYDLSYTKRQQTPFLAEAKAQGAAICYDGLTMLVWQAAFAFQRWFGMLPDPNKTISHITNNLQRTP